MTPACQAPADRAHFVQSSRGSMLPQEYRMPLATLALSRLAIALGMPASVTLEVPAPAPADKPWPLAVRPGTRRTVYAFGIASMLAMGADAPTVTLDKSSGKACPASHLPALAAAGDHDAMLVLAMISPDCYKTPGNVREAIAKGETLPRCPHWQVEAALAVAEWTTATLEGSYDLPCKPFADFVPQIVTYNGTRPASLPRDWRAMAGLAPVTDAPTPTDAPASPTPTDKPAKGKGRKGKGKAS